MFFVNPSGAEEKVRVAFSPDCWGREAISWVATIKGIDPEIIRDLMRQAVEDRFGAVEASPRTIGWFRTIEVAMPLATNVQARAV